jgi:hypothetical protein
MKIFEILCEEKSYVPLSVSFPDGITKCTTHYQERQEQRAIDINRVKDMIRRASIQYPDIWPEITTTNGGFVVLDSDGDFGFVAVKSECRTPEGKDYYLYKIVTAHATLNYYKKQQVIRLR